MIATIESRKLQAIKSTFLLSLPAHWVHNMGLKRGEDLDIVIFEEDNKFLSIVPRPDPKGIKYAAHIELSPKEYEILASPDEEEKSDKVGDKIIRKMVACYLVGFDDICIDNAAEKRESGLPDKLAKKVKEFINQGKLLGIRLSETTNELLMHVQPSSISIEGAMNEMCETIERMHNQVMNLIDQYDEKAADSVKANDNDVDSYHKYVVRSSKQSAKNPVLLVKLGMKNSRFLWAFRMISKRLELVGDNVQGICDTISMINKNNLTLREEMKHTVKRLCGETLELFKSMVEALFEEEYGFDKANSTIETAISIASDAKKAQMEIGASTRNVDVKTPDVSSAEVADWPAKLILMKISRITDYITTCAEIIQNLKISAAIRVEPIK